MLLVTSRRGWRDCIKDGKFRKSRLSSFRSGVIQSSTGDGVEARKIASKTAHAAAAALATTNPGHRELFRGTNTVINIRTK